MPKYLGVDYYQNAFDERRQFVNQSVIVAPNYYNDHCKYSIQGSLLDTLFRTPWKRANHDQEFIDDNFNKSEIKTNLSKIWKGRDLEITEQYYSQPLSERSSCDVISETQSSDDSLIRNIEVEEVYTTENLTNLKDELETESSWCLENVLTPDTEMAQINNIPTIQQLLLRMPECKIEDPLINQNNHSYKEREFFSDSLSHQESYCPTDLFTELYEKITISEQEGTLEEMLSLQDHIEEKTVVVDLRKDCETIESCRNDEQLEGSFNRLIGETVPLNNFECFDKKIEETDKLLESFIQMNNVTDSNDEKDFISKALLETPVMPYSFVAELRDELPYPEVEKICLSPETSVEIIKDGDKREIERKIWEYEKYFTETIAMRLKEPSLEESSLLTNWRSSMREEMVSLQVESGLGEVELKMSWDPGFYSVHEIIKLKQMEKYNCTTEIEPVVKINKKHERFSKYDQNILFDCSEPLMEDVTTVTRPKQTVSLSTDNRNRSSLSRKRNVNTMDDFLLMRTISPQTSGHEEETEATSQYKNTSLPVEQVYSLDVPAIQVTLIGSSVLIENTELLQLLERRYNTCIIEQNVDDIVITKRNPFPDLIIDEMTCIILDNFIGLSDDWYLESLLDKLMKLSTKYTHCWLILTVTEDLYESYPKLVRGENNLQKLHGSITNFTSSQEKDYIVQVVICMNMADCAHHIRKICDDKMKKEDTKNNCTWTNQSLLDYTNTEVNRFLQCFPGLNLFSAQILQKEFSIKEIFTLQFDQLKKRLSSIPNRMLKEFYNSISNDVGLQLRGKKPIEQTDSLDDIEIGGDSGVNEFGNNSLSSSPDSIYGKSETQRTSEWQAKRYNIPQQIDGNDEKFTNSQTSVEFNFSQPNQFVIATREGEKLLNHLKTSYEPSNQACYEQFSLIGSLKPQSMFDYDQVRKKENRNKNRLSRSSGNISELETIFADNEIAVHSNSSKTNFTPKNLFNMNTNNYDLELRNSPVPNTSTDHRQHFNINRHQLSSEFHTYNTDDIINNLRYENDQRRCINAGYDQHEKIDSRLLSEDFSVIQFSDEPLLKDFNIINESPPTQTLPQDYRRTLERTSWPSNVDRYHDETYSRVQPFYSSQYGINYKENSFTEELSAATKYLLNNSTNNSSLGKIFRKPQMQRIGYAQPFMRDKKPQQQSVSPDKEDSLPVANNKKRRLSYQKVKGNKGGQTILSFS